MAEGGGRGGRNALFSLTFIRAEKSLLAVMDM